MLMAVCQPEVEAMMKPKKMLLWWTVGEPSKHSMVKKKIQQMVVFSSVLFVFIHPSVDIWIYLYTIPSVLPCEAATFLRS